MFGGAAGGGKSDCLLMAALQYVDEPGYAALILRRTYADLALPNAIMDRADQWLRPTDAKWNDDTKTWTFPSGATLTFGYLERESHKYRYDGPEFQFIGFDELTHFTQSQYTYMFSRLRKLETSDIPIRMRSATNPGGPGHQWVKQRFIIEGRAKGRVFIPSKLSDNPSINKEEYELSLSELDPVTKQQKLDGNWDAAAEGLIFQREWFKTIHPSRVPTLRRNIRYWDLAGTKPHAQNKDPDYTCGLRMGDGVDLNWYISDVVRIRETPGKVEKFVRETAIRDGLKVKHYIEEDSGQAGKAQTEHYLRRVLRGFSAYRVKPVGTKPERVNPAAAAAQNGFIYLVEGIWVNDFLDEVTMFTDDDSHSHDDQVDCFGGAFNKLSHKKSATYRPNAARVLRVLT